MSGMAAGGGIALPALVQRIAVDTSDLSAADGQMLTFEQRTGRRMYRVLVAITAGVTVPLALVGGAAVRMSNKFESSLSKIVGLVGVSRDQVEAWRDDILELGPAVGRGPQELADAMFFVTSAGFRGQQAMDVLVASAKAATAGLGQTKTVADAVTSAVNAYGKENISAAEATDVLTATVREGKAEASSIAPVLGNILPVAAELGVEFNEVGASIAAMTRLGTDASTAATNLQNVLKTLLRPTKQSEKALEEYGLKAGQLRQQLAEEGLIPTLQTLQESFAGNEEAMGEVFPNIRALRGVLQLVGRSAETTEGIFQRMSDTTGAMNVAFEAAADTTQFRLNAAMAEAKAAGIEFGSELAPIVANLAEKVAGLVGAFTSLPDGVQSTITSLLALTAVAGPVLSLSGRLVANFKRLTDTLKASAAAGSISKLTSGMQGFAAALTGPVGLAIAGVVAALGAAVWWSNRAKNAYDTQREAAEKLGKSLEESAAQSTTEFVEANQNAIRQLREMGTESAQEAFLFEVGYTLVRRGEEPEAVFEKLQRLAHESGVELPLSFEAADLQSFEERLNQLRVSARSLGEDLSDAMTSVAGAGEQVVQLTSRMRADLGAIAQEAATAFRADRLTEAFTILEQYESALRSTGATTEQVDAAMNSLVDQFLTATNVQGLSTRSARNLQGALRELSSDASMAGRSVRDVLSRAMQIAEREGVGLGAAVERAANELSREADAAGAAAGPNRAGGAAMGSAAGSADDLATSASDAAAAIREQQRAILALTDPYFAALDASSRLEQAQRDLKTAQESEEATARDVANARRRVARAAFDLEAAERQLIAKTEESTASVGDLQRRLQQYVEQGRISQETADDIGAALEEVGSSAHQMAGAIDDAAKEAEGHLYGLVGTAQQIANSLGRDIALGIASGIDGNLEPITASARHAIDTALTAARLKARARSPSRLFAVQVGQPLSEGVAEGVLEKADAAESAVEQVVTRAAERANERLQGLFSALSATSSNLSARRELAASRRRLEELAAEQRNLPDRIAEAEEALADAREQAREVTPREALDLERAKDRVAQLREEMERYEQLPAMIADKEAELARQQQKVAAAQERLNRARQQARKVTGEEQARIDAALTSAAATSQAAGLGQASLQDVIRSQTEFERALDAARSTDTPAVRAAEENLQEVEQEAANAARRLKREIESLRKEREKGPPSINELKVAELDLAETRRRIVSEDMPAVHEAERRLNDLKDRQRQLTRDIFEANMDVREATLRVVEAQASMIEQSGPLLNRGNLEHQMFRDLAEQVGITVDQMENLIDVRRRWAQQGQELDVGLGDVMPRAAGGPFGAGDAMLVGEQGPELVRFGMPGRVTDSDTTREVLAGGDRHTHYHLQVEGVPLSRDFEEQDVRRELDRMDTLASMRGGGG